MGDGINRGVVSPAPPPATPRWQAALVAVALSLFSLVVLVPAGGTLLLVGSAAVMVGAAHWLDAVGAFDPAAFGASVYLAAAVLALTATAWVRGEVAVRWRGPRLAPLLPQRSSWIADHPWLGTAAACGVADLALIPAARFVGVPRGVLGAAVLASAALAEIGIFCLLVRAAHLFVRGLWRLTRRSSFAAGAVTASSFLAALGAYLFASALTAFAATLPGAHAVQTPPCDRPALTCARELLESVSRPRSTTSAPSLPTADERETFTACVEELRRDDPIRGNAYLDAIRIARMRVHDPAEAEDVVQDTLLEVCQHADRLGDVRGYFIRSVTNNAGRVMRRRRRECAVEPESVDWAPDRCIAHTVEQLYVQAEMQAATHDALCSLGRRDRTVIQLRVWEGLSHQDIARKLGWSEAAARQSYSRAIKALKEELELRCR